MNPSNIYLFNTSNTNTQSRNRNKSVGKRAKVKEARFRSINLEIEPVFNNKNKGSPFILMELSMRDYKRMRHNMIELTDIFLFEDMFAYHNVQYGKNIRFSSQKGNATANDNCGVKAIQLKQMKQNYIIAVADKSEVLKNCCHNNIIILRHSSQCVGNDEDKNKIELSGKLVLMVATMKINKSANDMCWNTNLFKTVKDCKNSVIDENNSHNGSEGYHFSFGNKAQYKMVNDSSVGQYATKKGVSITKKRHV